MTSALLLSGGMDSICLAWWKRPQVAYTIDYGQLPAAAEIAAARAVCLELGIPHHVLTVDVRALGSGDMTGTAPNALAPASDWWPFRNQFLLTVVGMHAVGQGVNRLWVGTVASDESHADGTTGFVARIGELMARQEGGLVVEAPAITMSTLELIRESGVPMSLLLWAHSCHRAEVACGDCRGCNKYLDAIEDLELDHVAARSTHAAG